MVNLTNYRTKINNIDEEIINLLSKRTKLSKKVGEYKKKNNLKVLDKKRENDIFEKLKKKSQQNGLNEKYTTKLFKTIIKNSRENQV